MMFDATEEIKKLQDSITLKFHDNPEQKYIYLDLVISPSKGSGFGTKAMKCLVKLSQEKGYRGTVNLKASYSSHLYHLYMGMIPIECSIDYVSYTYGARGKKALNIFAKCNNQTDFQKIDDYQFKKLASILSFETEIKKETITLETLIKNQELLLNLRNKKCSYLQNEFIPKVIDVLKSNIGEKYPDTSHFDSIDMTLSEKGKERWFKAIEEDSKFEPFKDLEQLRSYMTKEQIEELDEILSQHRSKISSIENQKESSISEIVSHSNGIKIEEENTTNTKINTNTLIEQQDDESKSLIQKDIIKPVINSNEIKVTLFSKEENSIDYVINTKTEQLDDQSNSYKEKENSSNVSENIFCIFNKSPTNNDVTEFNKKSFCIIL